MKIVPEKILRVTWKDTEQQDDISLAEAILSKLPVFETFGYLVHENKERIIICYNYCQSDPARDENDIMKIPKSCIIKMEEIK